MKMRWGRGETLLKYEIGILVPIFDVQIAATGKE
jgi:hypothetical protein